jgi:hypothetical protein
VDYVLAAARYLCLGMHMCSKPLVSTVNSTETSWTGWERLSDELVWWKGWYRRRSPSGAWYRSMRFDRACKIMITFPFLFFVEKMKIAFNSVEKFQVQTRLAKETQRIFLANWKSHAAAYACLVETAQRTRTWEDIYDQYNGPTRYSMRGRCTWKLAPAISLALVLLPHRRRPAATNCRATRRAAATAC